MRGGYLSIDAGAWAKENRIGEKAKEDGQMKFPPADQTEPDEIHTKIQSFVEGVANGCRKEVGAHLADLQTAIAGIPDDSGLALEEKRAKSMVDADLRTYDETAAQDENTLMPPLEEMRRQRAGVEEFRRVHELGDRQADYAKMQISAIWIAALGVVETVLNAVLLGEVMPYGIGGAFGVVVFITALNLLTGYLLVGPWWRRRNHVQPEPRAKALAGCLGIGALLLGFNVLVGQFRDAMDALGERLRSGELTDAAVMADLWRQAVEAPWEFDSFQAFLVAAVGFACFVFASVKGYGADDPYPGYGQITRMQKRAEENYAAVREEASKRFEQQHRECLAKIEDVLYAARAKRETYDGLVQEGKKVVEQFEPAIREFEQALRELTQIYRDTNRKHRGKERAPEYFNERRCLDERFFAPLSFEPPPRPGVDRLAERIGAEKERLNEHYEAVFSRGYPTS